MPFFDDPVLQGPRMPQGCVSLSLQNEISLQEAEVDTGTEPEAASKGVDGPVHRQKGARNGARVQVRLFVDRTLFGYTV